MEAKPTRRGWLFGLLGGWLGAWLSGRAPASAAAPLQLAPLLPSRSVPIIDDQMPIPCTCVYDSAYGSRILYPHGYEPPPPTGGSAQPPPGA